MERPDQERDRLLREGQWENLRDFAQADLAMARNSGDPIRQARALSILATAHGAMGNRQETLRLAREALRIRRQLGDALGTARALSGLSAAYAADHGPRQALKVFQMAFEAYRGLEEVEERCHAAAALGQILVSLERTREAHAVLDEAIAWCVDDTLAWCHWMLLEIKAAAFRADQDFDAAIRCLEQAFLMRQREATVSVACLRAIADLYLEAGRTWEGTEMYRMAIIHGREEGACVEVSRTEARMQKVMHPPDLQRGRLTSRGLKTPAWQRSH